MGREWSKSEREKIPATNQKKKKTVGGDGGEGGCHTQKESDATA